MADVITNVHISWKTIVSQIRPYEHAGCLRLARLDAADTSTHLRCSSLFPSLFFFGCAIAEIGEGIFLPLFVLCANVARRGIIRNDGEVSEKQ